MRHNKPGHRLASCAVAVLLLSSAAAHAEDYDDTETDTAPRTLGRLQFVPSSIVTWGFIENAFEVSSAAAYLTYDIGIAGAAPQLSALRTRNVKLYGVTESVSGAVALAPWLGIAGRLLAAGDIPREISGAVLVGVHANFGVEGDLFLRLARTEHFQLTARGDYSYNRERDVLSNVVRDQLVVGHVNMVRPALIAELALAPQVGLQASASYEWQWFDLTQHGRNETFEAAAAAVLALYPLPVTLLLGGGYGHAYGDSFNNLGALALYGPSGSWWRVEGGLFYTGRRDLDLGVSVNYLRSNTDNDRRGNATFRMSYYF